MVDRKKITVNFCDFCANFDASRFLSPLKKRYEIEFSDEPQFLFYSCFGNKYKKFNNCIKIFYSGENVRPDFNECDYAIGFDYIKFEDRYFRHLRDVRKSFANTTDQVLLDRKFCNFIYFNASSGEGAKKRQDFCIQLAKYKHVDCPGLVLNNMQDAITPRFGNWAEGKLDFIKNYKFTIAFENSSTPGYVTEKLLQPLQANSVPIYWGDPVVTRQFNPKAFVNCHDFESVEAVIEYIKYLDTHDDAYLTMLHQPAMQPDYGLAQHPTLEEFLVNIIEKGYQPQAKDPRSVWAHRHSKNLQLVLNGLKTKIFLPLQLSQANAAVQVKKIFSELPYSPKDAALYHSLANLVGHISDVPTTVLQSYEALDAPSPGVATQRVAVVQSVAARLQQASPLDKVRFAWSHDTQLAQAYRHIFSLLYPHDVAGKAKVRIGGKNDGGYVMLDPGQAGIAYSFGVSSHSPWDMQMAQRGFKVYQFDGTIENAPEQHGNLTFFKKNISGKAVPPDGCVNISQIFAMLKHEDLHDIILQMDIEGAEWEFFESITEEQLLKFHQIIVEFHGLTNKAQLPRYTAIFEKLCNTHCCIHFHYNNNGSVLGFKDFLVSNLFEVSFVRREGAVCTPSTVEYPTPLDAPCVTKYPEVYIGKFAIVTGIGAEPPRYVPSDLFDSYTLGGKIPIIDYYRDDRRTSGPVKNSKYQYENVISSINAGTFKYYDGQLLLWLQEAMNTFPLQNKTVLIYGLAGCNCDALALNAGAKRVIVVDYNPPIYEHPQVEVMAMDLFEKSNVKADVAFSISSFEHDGLGRYGDPLCPEGDLLAMHAAAHHLIQAGLLFLAVPVGPDCLAWNAHRIYGTYRLPMLIEGWNCLQSFGLNKEDFKERPLGRYIQPIFVLSNSPGMVHTPKSATSTQAAQIADLAAHGAFDRAYYTKTYPEILASPMDAISHYVIYGAKEGKNPTPWFNSQAYRTINSNLSVEVNPFWHYLFHGCQGRPWLSSNGGDVK